MEKIDLNPLISIIIPLYDSELHISESIESVIAQTYSNWELIIVNDGSRDNGLTIAEKYKSDKVRIFSKENGGAAAARNYGYLKAAGSFIKFLDADDLINPEMLDNQLRLALVNENFLISSKWGRFYKNDIHTFKLNPEDCWKNMLPIDWICSSWGKGESMTQPGIFLIPQTILRKTGLWNEKLSLIDDFEFFTRIILASEGIIFSERSILFYRSGLSNSLSGLRSRKGAESELLAVRLATKEVRDSELSDRTKQICAIAYANFIFNYYPRYNKLLKIAYTEYKQLTNLNLSTFAPESRWGIKKIFGWKIIQYLKFIKYEFFNA